MFTITMKLMFIILFIWTFSRAAQFHDMSYDEINSALSALSGTSAAVSSADSLWGPHMKSSSCVPSVLKITDIPSCNKFTTTRPQVVVSGEIHGDERVGPSASLFSSQLLVWSAQCHVYKRHDVCERLSSLHITESQTLWMAFLATRRETIVMPTPNCMGYRAGVRTDAGVDTNRDFPYSRKDSNCLKSKTAKVFDALFRDATVQILVTFHGGMVAIGYEWGTFDHPKGSDQSPDNNAHKSIGGVMSRVAGSFRAEKAYSAAPMNSLVYPVHGGMEDWAYAAGWDTKLMHSCDGLSLEMSTPPPNRAAAFLVETSNRKKPPDSELGEDVDVLRMDAASNNLRGGHVPRNARLTLSAVDIVQPYVCISQDSSILSPSVSTPQRPRPSSLSSVGLKWYVGGAIDVDRTWLSWHASDPSLSTLSPEAWEGFVLNSLEPPLPPTEPSTSWTGGEQKGTAASMKTGVAASGFLSGPGRWKWANPLDISTGHVFSVGSVHIPPLEAVTSTAQRRLRSHHGQLRGAQHTRSPHNTEAIVGDSSVVEVELLLVAWAEVDQTWGVKGQGHPATTRRRHGRTLHPRNNTTTRASSASHDVDVHNINATSRILANGEPFPPQTHLVNARTNPQWVVKNDKGHVKVQGRRFWPSDPLIVKLLYQKDGLTPGAVVEVKSAVTDCAWWRRRVL